MNEQLQKYPNFSIRQFCCDIETRNKLVTRNKKSKLTQHLISALANPGLEVFVLSLLRQEDKKQVNITPLMTSILSYENVHFNSINLEDFPIKTPMEEFTKSKQLEKSQFIVEHTADALRLLVLWRYGGTYVLSF